MDLSGVRQRIPLPLSLNEVDRVAQYAAHMAQHELLDDVERVRERLLRAQARQEEWQAQQTALDEADEAVRQRVAEAAQSELSNAAQCAQLIQLLRELHHVGRVPMHLRTRPFDRSEVEHPLLCLVGTSFPLLAALASADDLHTSGVAKRAIFDIIEG